MYLVLFSCLSASGLHLLARSSLTVSAASMRKDIKDHVVGDVSEEKEGEVGEDQEQLEEVGDLPPSSFRSVALVGAPR